MTTPTPPTQRSKIIKRMDITADEWRHLRNWASEYLWDSEAKEKHYSARWNFDQTNAAWMMVKGDKLFACLPIPLTDLRAELESHRRLEKKQARLRLAIIQDISGAPRDNINIKYPPPVATHKIKP